MVIIDAYLEKPISRRVLRSWDVMQAVEVYSDIVGDTLERVGLAAYPIIDNRGVRSFMELNPETESAINNYRKANYNTKFIIEVNDLGNIERVVLKVMLLADSFIERTKWHKYALNVGLGYPDHDADKLTGELLDGYKYIQAKNITKSQEKALNEATYKHIITNPHHLEYWAKDKEALKNFDRKNPPMGLDCTAVEDSALIEMCADWCARAEEFGNSPIWWLEKNINKR